MRTTIDYVTLSPTRTDVGVVDFVSDRSIRGANVHERPRLAEAVARFVWAPIAADACLPVDQSGAHAPFSASGSTIEKVAPSPGAECAETAPPCACATAETMARPSPTPPLARARESSAR